MIYELHFHPAALKEWKKLSVALREQFKKVLLRRLEEPHVASAMLHSKLKHCYKIKLRQSGYRLVYTVKDEELIVLVVAVAKRDKNKVYELASDRER